jgi:formylmethanofuran dehydrogenase subunit C
MAASLANSSFIYTKSWLKDRDRVTPLILTLKAMPAQPVDLSSMTPDRLAEKTLPEIEKILLPGGNCQIRVAEIFDVTGDDKDNLLIRGGCDRLNRIGFAMTRGTITVEGSAGMYAGMRMRGGALTVNGDAGAFAASGMSDGLLHIKGNAGDFLGGAIAGERHGIGGGTVIVDGDAGDRAGDRMRRGMLLVKGNAGDYCGARMLAGTIVVRGRVGYAPGFSMQRGTLLLAKMPRILATFNDCGTHTLPFLRLLRKYFEDSGPPFTEFALIGERVRRFVGDLGNDGLGEILVYE